MPGSATPLDSANTVRGLVLDASDNVCMPCADVRVGNLVLVDGHLLVRALHDVALGHKVARETIAAGTRIVKGGVPIGTATQSIVPGAHVHTWNMRSDYLPTYTLKDGLRQGGAEG